MRIEVEFVEMLRKSEVARCHVYLGTLRFYTTRASAVFRESFVYQTKREVNLQPSDFRASCLLGRTHAPVL